MVLFMILYMIYCCYIAASDHVPAQRADPNAGGHQCDADLDRPMDFDDERDFADLGPLTEEDIEEDAQILATLLKHIPSCMNTADIEQLLKDIPVQPPVVIPARTVQEAVAAGDLPPLNVDAANVFTQSEHILQEHVRKHGNNATEVKDLIQRVLHHPDFNADEVDHDLHERPSRRVISKSLP